MAAHVFTSAVATPLLLASPVAGDGGAGRGRRRQFFRPCLVASRGRESSTLSDDFDFQVTHNGLSMQTYICKISYVQ
jgi:hypothetical protein